MVGFSSTLLKEYVTGTSVVPDDVLLAVDEAELEEAEELSLAWELAVAFATRPMSTMRDVASENRNDVHVRLLERAIIV